MRHRRAEAEPAPILRQRSISPKEIVSIGPFLPPLRHGRVIACIDLLDGWSVQVAVATDGTGYDCRRSPSSKDLT